MPDSTNDPGVRTVRKRLADGTIKTYTYARDRKATRRLGRFPPGTVGALLIAYRQSPEWKAKAPTTILNYNIYLSYLDEMGLVQVRDVRRRQIIGIRDLVAHNCGNGAASAFVRIASAAFRWAISREWIEHNPVSKIDQLEGGSLLAWSLAQAEHGMRTLEEPLRRVILLGMYTAQRRGDLCALTWAAYDGKMIRLTQKKTRVSLAIPVHPRLAAELDAWKRSATSTHILTTAKGQPWKPVYLSSRFRTKTMAADMAKGLNVHGLRKLAATLLAEVGCSTHEIAAITGHKTLAMVQHYTASASQEKLAEAAIVRLRSAPTNRRKAFWKSQT